MLRCFDLTPDPFEALETAADLGFTSIITSGQAQTANEGAGLLAALMGRSAGRIIIMPGAGIRAETVGGLRHLPLGEIHASCRSANAGTGRGVLLGFSPAVVQRTDAARIRALRLAAGAGA